MLVAKGESKLIYLVVVVKVEGITCRALLDTGASLQEKSIRTSARKRCIHSKCINTQLNIHPLSPKSM